MAVLTLQGEAMTDDLPPLPEPAIPRRWYCNKCGHLGEAGPEHDVCAGAPLTRCQYSAIPHGPYWSDEQVRLIAAQAVAAERERCIAAIRAVGPSGGALALITEGFVEAIRNRRTP